MTFETTVLFGAIASIGIDFLSAHKLAQADGGTWTPSTQFSSSAMI